MPHRNDYKPYLVKLMSFLDEEDYDKDHEFTPEQLGELTPAMLMRWFNLQVFGVEVPPAQHELPALKRSNSLAYWKKAISFFMPNQLMQWNALTGVGNPTKSKEVNQLIKLVKKREVRGQGVASQARRPIRGPEYKRIVQILKEESEEDNIMMKYGIPAMMNYQFHLISRIDCACQALVENLQPTPIFSFALKTRLRWSKNVLEERQAPWQIMLASMDHVYCNHISLALWLELYVEADPEKAELSPYLFAFSDDVAVPSGGDKAKDTVQNIYRKDIFDRPEFAETGKLGSHSVRKYAATECRNKGSTKDERDLRGRWKINARVADRYDDVELPYVDAKVAALLCVGGPCKYKVREDAGITNQWILQNVMPHGRTKTGDETAIVLGRALLWLAFSTVGEENMPHHLYQRIHDAYRAVNNDLPDGITNPVDKLPVVVTGSDGEVYIDEIPHEMQGNNEQGLGGGFGNRPVQQQLLALHSSMLQLRRQLEEHAGAFAEHRIQTQRNYQTLNTNVRRIAMAPALRGGVNQAANGNQGADGNLGAAVGAANANGAATLSPTPRTVHALWQEYMEGIGGRKPARLFTPEERGLNKHRFTRRKVVWDTIDRLIRRGFTANVACDQIYEHYGRQLSVTRVINAMLQDRRNGAIPAVLQ